MHLGLWGPRHWPIWLCLGVLRGVERLPFKAQMAFGRVLGATIRRLPLSFVRVARRNIELCYPSMPAAARAKLLDRHCSSLGKGLCETAATWWSADATIGRRAEIHGFDHLHAALAAGRGAIVIGGHFTTIEIATRILGTALPLNVVYRLPKNPVLSRTMSKNFARHGKPIRHDDIRAMIRALRRNEVVWYAPDQSYRNKGAAMVDFFGIPAATTTATSRLARISGAAVLTYFTERLAGDHGYRAVIGPALENFPSECAARDAERINGLIEAQARRVPEQYLWTHRRFKGLDADYPNYYGRDARARPRIR